MKKHIFTVLFITLFFASCSSDESIDSEGDEGFTGVINITGKAQKGPLITGSDVSIAELNNDLTPTGRIFTSIVSDDDGSYTVPNVELVSPYVEISVEGFYYDEIRGRVSDNEITINSLALITEDGISNVNILTHLEDQRVRSLIASGMSFTEAKRQSYQELVTIFGADISSETTVSNDLTLNDAFLFAVSTILSGVEWDKDQRNKYAAWVKFLFDFEEDFGDNGEIESSDVSDKLFLGAFAATNVVEITKQLEDTFDDIGVDLEIPDFESYVTSFLDNSSLSDEAVYNKLFPSGEGEEVNIIRLTSELSSSDDNYIIISVQTEFQSVEFGAYYMSVGGNGSFSADSDEWDDFYEHTENDTTYGHYSVTLEGTEVFKVPVSFTGSGELNVRYDIVRTEEDYVSTTWKPLNW